MIKRKLCPGCGNMFNILPSEALRFDWWEWVRKCHHCHLNPDPAMCPRFREIYEAEIAEIRARAIGP